MKTNQKRYLLGLFAAFLLVVPVSHASAEGGRFLVKSKSGFLQNTIGVRNNLEEGFTADLSDFQIGLLKLFRVEVEPVKVLHILPAEDSTDTALPTPTPERTPKVNAIKSKGGLRYVPSDSTPWGIEAVYHDAAVVKTTGGEGVKVAVLDTGVLKTHPDLKNRITGCKDFTQFRSPMVDGQCDDKNGHGTHVSGIIAADGGADHLGVYGVAPAASLMAYKVCDNNGSCYADDIALGIRKAADDGANVINMSFGSDTESGLIADAINYAFDKGVLPVAAAGNDGPDQGSIDYPGANPKVIAVAALNKVLEVTEWSSRGTNSLTDPATIDEKDVEVAMPGDGIESTWKSGSYAVLSGTSMASPFMAGMAAKFWQAGAIPQEARDNTRSFLHTLTHDLLPIGDDDASGLGFCRVQ